MDDIANLVRARCLLAATLDDHRAIVGRVSRAWIRSETERHIAPSRLPEPLRQHPSVAGHDRETPDERLNTNRLPKLEPLINAYVLAGAILYGARLYGAGTADSESGVQFREIENDLIIATMVHDTLGHPDRLSARLPDARRNVDEDYVEGIFGPNVLRHLAQLRLNLAAFDAAQAAGRTAELAIPPVYANAIAALKAGSLRLSARAAGDGIFGLLDEAKRAEMARRGVDLGEPGEPFPERRYLARDYALARAAAALPGVDTETIKMPVEGQLLRNVGYVLDLAVPPGHLVGRYGAAVAQFHAALPLMYRYNAVNRQVASRGGQESHEGQPSREGQLLHGGRPSYNGQPLHQRQSADDGQPSIAGQLSYEWQPSIAGQLSHEWQPSHEEQPAHEVEGPYALGTLHRTGMEVTRYLHNVRRKGYGTGAGHSFLVSSRAESFLPGYRSVPILAGSDCHDLVEDGGLAVTGYDQSLELFAATFGAPLAALVAEVTDSLTKSDGVTKAAAFLDQPSLVLPDELYNVGQYDELRTVATDPRVPFTLAGAVIKLADMGTTHEEGLLDPDLMIGIWQHSGARVYWDLHAKGGIVRPLWERLATEIRLSEADPFYHRRPGALPAVTIQRLKSLVGWSLAMADLYAVQNLAILAREYGLPDDARQALIGQFLAGDVGESDFAATLDALLDDARLEPEVRRRGLAATYRLVPDGSVERDLAKLLEYRRSAARRQALRRELGCEPPSEEQFSDVLLLLDLEESSGRD